MHGLGNDFIIVDVRGHGASGSASNGTQFGIDMPISAKASLPLFDRATGLAAGEGKDGAAAAAGAALARTATASILNIGADGIIFSMDLGGNALSDAERDWIRANAGTARALSMRMWNSDGSAATMCGNGIRCLAAYAQTRDALAEMLAAVAAAGGAAGVAAPALEAVYAVETPSGLRLCTSTMTQRTAGILRAAALAEGETGSRCHVSKVVQRVFPELDDFMVAVDMGLARIAPAQIPMKAGSGEEAVDLPPGPWGKGGRVTAFVSRKVDYFALAAARAERAPAAAAAAVAAGSSGAELPSVLREWLTQSLRLTAVSMGNPHAIALVDAAAVRAGVWDALVADDKRCFKQVAQVLCGWHIFTDQANIEFYRVESAEGDAPVLDSVVWERGAGATLACGTGACAVAVAHALLTVPSAGGADSAGASPSDGKRVVTVVKMPGGPLEISWVPNAGAGAGAAGAGAGAAWRPNLGVVMTASATPQFARDFN